MDVSETEALKAGASTVILIHSDGMGSAEEALRHKLLRSYLTLLRENGFYPDTICFYAEGIKMAVEGSPVLDILQDMESAGVRLIVCGTCLQYFGLKDQLAVGIVGGMNDIIRAQWTARKVITL
jgi:selenium metabolism protein YedF